MLNSDAPVASSTELRDFTGIVEVLPTMTMPCLLYAKNYRERRGTMALRLEQPGSPLQLDLLDTTAQSIVYHAPHPFLELPMDQGQILRVNLAVFVGEQHITIESLPSL